MGTPSTPPACMRYDHNFNPGSYGYDPSLSWGIVFSIAFGSIAIAHLLRVLQTRSIWAVLFVGGAVMETIGWIARGISHACPYSRPLFLMQTCTLIMGPSWTQAAIYITLWEIVRDLGRQISPFPPTFYLLACFLIDVVCLSLQATGGGLAGAAYTAGTSTQPGTTTMVAGIIAQLGVAVLFCFLFAIVLHRGKDQLRQPAKKRTLYVAIAVVVAIAMLILRNIYRSIELLQGWRGYLITHQVYVLALDALPMTIAMGIFVFIHPKLPASHSISKTNIDRNGDVMNTGECKQMESTSMYADSKIPK